MRYLQDTVLETTVLTTNVRSMKRERDHRRVDTSERERERGDEREQQRHQRVKLSTRS